MWEEKDFLEMMQVNSDLYGDEITHITGADDAWLINYFEHRLVKLFPPYSFMESKFCKVIHGKQGDIEEERLVDEGFGLSVKQCVEIGNFIACRYHLDWLDKSPQFSELTTAVVLNYIEHGYPLDETQYKINYHPRTVESSTVETITDTICDAIGGFLFGGSLFPFLDSKDEAEGEQKE